MSHDVLARGVFKPKSYYIFLYSLADDVAHNSAQATPMPANLTRTCCLSRCCASPTKSKTRILLRIYKR